MLNGLRNLTVLALAAVAVFSIAIFVTAGIALSQDESSYAPSHNVGSGDDDWWITYPDQNENSGKEVPHPDWMLDALKEEPVLILIHSSTCVPCRTQTPRIKAAVEKYGDDLDYHDVLGEGSSLQEAVDILDVYDPYGIGKPVVPTTIFVTLAKGPDGKVGVAWHSEVDAMSEERIDSFVNDAIYYYKQNRATWT
ncbi:MAG: thioredoxin family protein [Methanothrix sp.]|nr:thioredoxin family protein [Methanothrix sp.]